MKLYVWEDVLTDYTSGMMFALADSADDARVQLIEQCDYLPTGDLAKEPRVFDTTDRVAFIVWGGG